MTITTPLVAAAVKAFIWRRTRVPEERMHVAMGSSQINIRMQSKQIGLSLDPETSLGFKDSSHVEVWACDFKFIVIPIA